MNWLDIDEELYKLWDKSKTVDEFYKKAGKRFNWTPRQSIQNAGMIEEVMTKSRTSVSSIDIKRRTSL